jgi:septum formation protein
MGKPHSREEAVRMLVTLSGREHQVITAVTIRDARREITFTDTSNVYFKDLSRAEIDFYIDRYKPFDKAGAYGIQEWIGYAGITRIEGSYFNIVGLPVHRVYAELQAFL